MQYFFLKKVYVFAFLTHIVFKKPLWARYCQRIFPDVYLLLSFFIFCRGSASYF